MIATRMNLISMAVTRRNRSLIHVLVKSAITGVYGSNDNNSNHNNKNNFNKNNDKNTSFHLPHLVGTFDGSGNVEHSVLN